MFKKANLFLSAPFFMVRVPMLPIDLLKELYSSKDPKQLVKAFYNHNDLFKEAISIASDSLKSSVDHGASDEPIWNALLKYYLRMTSRPTPFGLFSFVSLGHIGPKAGANFNLNDVIKRARPDMEWLQEVIAKISEDPNVFIDLPVQRNLLICNQANRYLIGYLREKKDQISSSIRKSILTESIFELSKSPITIRNLISKLIQQSPELEFDKLKEVILKLLNQQFLELSLLPSLLSLSPFEDFLIKVPKFYLPKLSHVAQEIAKYSYQQDLNSNKENVSTQLKLLDDIKTTMKSLAKSEHYLQVDSVNPIFQPTLSQQVIDDVTQSAEVLWMLTPDDDLIGLENYTNRFIAKYGYERIVPLFELLDASRGLGIPNWYENSSNIKDKADSLTNFLSELVFDSFLMNKSEIEITGEIIDKWKHSIPLQKALPSMDIYFEVIANSEEDINSGNYRILLTNQTWQGGATFNRFVDMFDDKFKKEIQNFFREEENLDPGSRYIETSYLPKSSRAQNVAIHPCPRKEVLNLSPGGDSTIAFEDLYVGAGPSGLFITSKNGDIEYFFTATNALNPNFAPIPLRFIRDVSKSKYRMSLFWGWKDLSQLPYLPRVRFNKVILSPAEWNVSLRRIDGSLKESVMSLREKFEKWANKYRMDRYIYMSQLDQRLLIDRSNKEMVDEIIRLLKQGIVIKFTEKIGQENGEWVKSNKGKHAAEFVLPLIKNPTYHLPPSSNIRPSYLSISPNIRWKLPGSDWLYAKLYMSPDMQKRFITNQLMPFANALVDQKLINQWFFVRYVNDGRHHIRVRFNSLIKNNFPDIVDPLHQWSQSLIREGLLQDIALASYEREIERYGGPELMDYAENLFCADSQTSSQLLLLETSDLPLHIIGSFSIIRLLEDFRLTQDEIQAFFLEYPIEKTHLDGFRKWKKIFESSTPLSIDTALNYRSLAINHLSQQISRKSDNGFLTTSRFSIINSLIHMHCNRLFGINEKLEIQSRAYASHSIKQKLGRQLSSH